jgi:putative glutamine amidotransferase
VGRKPALDRLDGVIVGGGDDISATIYGGEIDPAVRIDPDRDALELQVLRHASAHALPVLGICRGAQMINVFLGGSLHTDIYAVYEQAPRQRTVLPRKTVHVNPDSKLGSILECLSCRVNALHHQSVDQLGRELRVVARDDHDMIQAIEDPGDRFVIGVQWHPEFLIFDRGQRRLFHHLVEAARGE